MKKLSKVNPMSENSPNLVTLSAAQTTPTPVKHRGQPQRLRNHCGPMVRGPFYRPSRSARAAVHQRRRGLPETETSINEAGQEYFLQLPKAATSPNGSIETIKQRRQHHKWLLRRSEQSSTFREMKSICFRERMKLAATRVARWYIFNPKIPSW
jgi:hypothetical protein